MWHKRTYRVWHRTIKESSTDMWCELHRRLIAESYEQDKKMLSSHGNAAAQRASGTTRMGSLSVRVHSKWIQQSNPLKRAFFLHDSCFLTVNATGVFLRSVKTEMNESQADKIKKYPEMTMIMMMMMKGMSEATVYPLWSLLQQGLPKASPRQPERSARLERRRRRSAAPTGSLNRLLSLNTYSVVRTTMYGGYQAYLCYHSSISRIGLTRCESC